MHDGRDNTISTKCKLLKVRGTMQAPASILICASWCRIQQSHDLHKAQLSIMSVHMWLELHVACQQILVESSVTCGHECMHIQIRTHTCTHITCKHISCKNIRSESDIGIACGIHVLESVGSLSHGTPVVNLTIVSACANDITHILCTKGANMAFTI